MLKNVFSAICIFFVLGIVYYLTTSAQVEELEKEIGTELESIDKTDLADLTSTEVSQSAVALALKAFILSQGEGGAALWRLNATAGNMYKDEGIIKVEAPKLVYYMPPDNEELQVTAKTGDIQQETKVMRFLGDVVIVHSDSTIKGDLLVYNGTNRTMQLPTGGTFSDQSIQGSADDIIWHITNRVIEATGSVDVTFEVDDDTLPMRP